ncbi:MULTISPECIES: DUF1353 domain-containing protein [Asticcacaulis]|uniref:DUF1353 domain-containing protein n=1 Tax=Asticcacaulis TaxID=76890 RepID=UPI001AEA5231|nr:MULTISPECIES: DUF1353 domain-containing protein [Asticcacaulis]MBP2159556.1 hypothetical protein [Asticcacaulis solisilvae]MDR6800617.1 hypothetical protein [Asticcacaulis sp. BE141]
MIIRSVAFGIFTSAFIFCAPAIAKGRFTGEIVAKWLPDGIHMELTQPITYTDSRGTDWPVPTGSMINGASIPPFWWTSVGSPYTGRYRDASVIHDYYCDVRVREDKEVHYMLYDAMLTSGVEKFRAKLMYGAVLVGGPKWDMQAVHNARLASHIPAASSGGYCRALLGKKICVPIIGYKVDGPRDIVKSGHVKRNLTSKEINEALALEVTDDMSLEDIEKLVQEYKAKTITVTGNRRLLLHELDKFDIENSPEPRQAAGGG